MRTIGAFVNRTKNLVKGVKHDAFLTDRLVYSLIMKYAKPLMRRQDSANKLMRFNSVFQALTFVELVEVDTVEAGCVGISSDCKIKRTKLKLPLFMEGYWGPLIGSVTSLDGSEYLVATTPTDFINIIKQKNHKFNRTKYFWFLNGYLYFPNLEWDGVKLTGVFDDDVSKFNCDCEDSCVQRQDQPMNVPDFLDADIERLVLADLGAMLQVPMDNRDDKVNPLR